MSRTRRYSLFAICIAGILTTLAFFLTVGLVYLFATLILGVAALSLVVAEGLKTEKAKHLQTVNTEKSE